ncbi:hypothetical protein Rwratislav_22642 [Rhodococcus wratislaviensis IFP 2016]|nr:hypothetical protein Rwratislav_22642 [Rhodococcus wratislaviensis IFP 2016]
MCVPRPPPRLEKAGRQDASAIGGARRICGAGRCPAGSALRCSRWCGAAGVFDRSTLRWSGASERSRLHQFRPVAAAAAADLPRWRRREHVVKWPRKRGAPHAYARKQRQHRVRRPSGMHEPGVSTGPVRLTLPAHAPSSTSKFQRLPVDHTEGSSRIADRGSRIADRDSVVCRLSSRSRHCRRHHHHDDASG